MSIAIKATLDTRSLKKWIDATSKKTIQRVVAKSINRTVGHARTVAQKKIREQIKLPAKAVRDALKISKKALPSQPIDSQQATIHAETAGVSLSKFRPKQVARGVRVNITGKPTLIRHAFIWKRGSKSPVFRRVSIERPSVVTKRVGKNKSQLPIMKKATQAIATQFAKVAPDVQIAAQRKFGEEFARNYAHAMRST